MGEINKNKEFDRIVKQAMKKRARKQMLMWTIGILLISTVLSFAIYFAQKWYSEFTNSPDTINLTDIERQYKNMGKNPLDDIKKYDSLLKKLKER